MDFEFNPEDWIPTIAGVSSGENPVSAYYSSGFRDLLDRLNRAEVTWVGHNAVAVEREILQAELGTTIPLDRIGDTMVSHYLVNSEMCKDAAKTEEEEEKGQGYMDLWSMSSLYTDLPQWKTCRGSKCAGPCPLHDVRGYNGTDAYAADVAWWPLEEERRSKHIPDALVDHVKRLMVLCGKMTRQGIRVDFELVDRLEKEFSEKKDLIFPSHYEVQLGKKGQVLKTPALVWDAPFNPRSPKQVMDWFRAYGVPLKSTDKEDIQHALLRGEDIAPEVREWLIRLHDYKDQGKGLKAWTDRKFIGRDGLMHPRFNPTGTSMGRLSSSWPNFQNIPRVGWGKKVRAAIVPRREGLILAKADYSQLELRICLWYSGITEPLPGDAFSWLVAEGQGLFEQAAELTGNGKLPRDIAKSVSHGGDYGEGLTVLYGADLSRPKTKKAIEFGALVVYKDWQYHGGVVGFTGVNLAERLFGSATWENRRKALQIQEAYFKRFSIIRQWQRKVSRDAEKGYVQTASGRYLTLYGSPEDKLKTALAAHGQGGGADYCQEAMLKYDQMGYVPMIQVHDELVFEFPVGTPNKDILSFFSLMSTPSTFMPGFTCPVKVSVGPNWLDMEEIGKA